MRTLVPNRSGTGLLHRRAPMGGATRAAVSKSSGATRDLCDADDELAISANPQHWLAQGPRSRGPQQLARNWRQLDLQEIEEERPPETPAVRIKNASLSVTTLSFLFNMPTKQGLNAYDENGMDPVRFHSVVEKGCSSPSMTSTTSGIIRCSKATGSTWCTRCTPASASGRSNVGSQVQGLHADVSGRSSAKSSVCLGISCKKLYKHQTCHQWSAQCGRCWPHSPERHPATRRESMVFPKKMLEVKPMAVPTSKAALKEDAQEDGVVRGTTSAVRSQQLRIIGQSEGDGDVRGPRSCRN